MSIWSRLFGRTGGSGPAPTTLALEGSELPFFAKEEEEAFLQSCAASGQGALGMAFADYWEVSGRGYRRKILDGGTRLLCARCLNDMPFSFQMALPGGMGGGSMIVMGEGLPSNMFGAADKAVCPWCSSRDGVLLWDHAPYGDITEQDLAAVRELWRQRCLLWWRQNTRGGRLCDRCAARDLPEGQGYHNGSEVICEACALSSTDADALAALCKNPDYFGTSELRRARNVVAGRWRFEGAALR